MPPRESALSNLHAVAKRPQRLKKLATLVFANVGKPAKKRLNLWRQGDIRILINEETTGHASTTWNAPLACVCGIGIGVDNAQTVIT